ncbi:Aspartate/glutamate/uridylate kinase [Globomyces pollinis-pini]|nr:Aspartate/glutamate/uridylate kinase [Globomyces pollinis-pini]
MLMDNLKEPVVLKFGGTSVGTAERLLQVAEIVNHVKLSQNPIIVLSAMSGTNKKEGTTSRLLEAVEEILKPESQRYLDIVDSIQTSHITAARQALAGEANASLLKQLEMDITLECDKLRSFMAAAEIIEEISAKSKDIIMSVGEKLSARTFAAVLKSTGTPTKYISLDKLINKKFEKNSLDQSFYNYLSDRLNEVLTPFYKTHVCVVTGFFGPCPGSLLDTVGRGYTDLTAALISAGLKVKELQIWKEVDGIFTADPRKVPRAKKLAYISPEEAAELTYYGSEVIHPFTMEQCIRASIPIRIKNTFNPAGSGTIILPDGHSRNLSPTNSGFFDAESAKHPTAVTIKDNVIVVTIHSNRKSVSHGFLAQTFLILDKHGIVVDLISTSEVHVSMALNNVMSEEKLEKALIDIRKYGTVDILRDQVILSLVGKLMRNTVGISSKMFSTLAKHNVNIEMISQGASEINISCVIDQNRALDALVAIHDEIVVPLK